MCRARAWLLLIAAAAVSAQTAERVALPARALRGYGTLAAQFVRYPHGSKLYIAAADARRAAVVLSKFGSDLHLLGGVSDDGGVWRLPSGAAMTAWREGAAVVVLTAERAADLPALVTAHRPAKFDAPTVPVPAYLDSWDKHGFRYYYYPWQTPGPDWGADKRVEWQKYHMLGEFDFAKQTGDLGFVFWTKPEMVDLADGQWDTSFWDWGARAAAKRGSPLVLNTSLEQSSTWLLNRYRDQTKQMAPQYLGGFYAPGEGWSAGKGHLSWCADSAADTQYALMSRVVGEYAAQPTTLEYLEPHGEMRHGEHDKLTEYGPLADANYRVWLRQRYGALPALAKRWDRPLADWSQVRVPELAEFVGFDERAIDLAGPWRLGYDAPEAAWQPAFDDGAWPQLAMPGSDLALLTPRKPVLVRRHFTVAADRLPGGRVWLYVFDLNRGHREVMPAVLNGQKLGESKFEGPEHWAAFEATGALKAGENLLALRLPQGFFGYRVYLSAHAPVEYPYLGPGRNAQWADFVRWQSDIRIAQLARGFSAIRQADPDRSIVCMAPDAYTTGIKQLCERFGGHFHNTGYMSGWWAEPLTMLMRGSDLPFSLEPGSHAHDVPELQRFVGCWATEGVNAIHYFIHIGAIYWHPAMRQWFTEHLKLMQSFGKLHVPKAEVALLLTDDSENLTGFPWGRDRGDNLANGYVPCQLNVHLHNDYHMDAVSERDFAPGGAADGYRVVIDSGTPIMDPPTVTALRGWVERGGTFVTFNQTGRHTSTLADAWPISELTGFDVAKVDLRGRAWTFEPGQRAFNEADWKPNERRGEGLNLVPRSPECRPLLRWADGSVACGWRQVGQGSVIHLGVGFGNNPRLYRALLQWLAVKPVPFKLEGGGLKSGVATHLVSNNGLYDAFAIWNNGPATTLDLVFRDGAPSACWDVNTNEAIPLTEDRAKGLALPAGETRLFLTPKSQARDAALDWFKLQRNWWRGTEAPVKRVAPYQPKFACDLTEDWAVKWLDDADAADHSALASPDLPDRDWPRQRLRTWLVPDEQPTHRALFRRAFTVPAAWQGGEVALWLQGWIGDVTQGRYRVWLDGAELRGWGEGQRGIAGLALTDKLAPGSRHSLAIEFASAGEVAGPDGHVWLYWLPAPAATDDLAGAWEFQRDVLDAKATTANLPGVFDGLLARRTVRVDAAHAGQNVVLHLDAELNSGLTGLYINGHWLMRLHHDIGARTLLNITPWVKFGADNEVILKRSNPGKTRVQSVRLDYFPREVYP